MNRRTFMSELVCIVERLRDLGEVGSKGKLGYDVGKINSLQNGLVRALKLTQNEVITVVFDMLSAPVPMTQYRNV
jgi:hypothetical protein